MTVAYEARNPRYSARANQIDLEYNHPDYGWIPFTACAADVDEHGQILYTAALAGQYGPVAGVLPKTAAQQLSEIAEQRWYQQQLPLLWQGHLIALDGESPAAMDQSLMAVERGFRQDTDGWKCYDLSTGAIVWRVTTNAEIVELSQLAYRYVQDCFTREGALIAQVKAGTYTDSMLTAGWPA